jgi:spore germination cell wall hydrolase CwlJ-like protein
MNIINKQTFLTLGLLSILSIALIAINNQERRELQSLVFQQQEYINSLENELSSLKDDLNIHRINVNEVVQELNDTRDWQITQVNERISHLENEIIDISNKRIILTNEEMERFYKLVMAEAGGEGIVEQRWVASVVINRILADDFPDSLTSVMRQNGQFSVMKDGSYGKYDVTESVKEAVKDALLHDYAKGSLYFLNVDLAREQGYGHNADSMLNELEYVDEIGKITFLK